MRNLIYFSKTNQWLNLEQFNLEYKSFFIGHHLNEFYWVLKSSNKTVGSGEWYRSEKYARLKLVKYITNNQFN